MSPVDTSRAADASLSNLLCSRYGKNRCKACAYANTSHADLQSTLRLIIEATLQPHLDSITESIRDLAAANDDRLDDRTHVFRLPVVLQRRTRQ